MGEKVGMRADFPPISWLRQILHTTFLPPNICATFAPVCKVVPYGMQRCNTTGAYCFPTRHTQKKNIWPANIRQKEHEHDDRNSHTRVTPCYGQFATSRFTFACVVHVLHAVQVAEPLFLAQKR
jgi:hypothetical protein